jgi:hypothetical protein
MADDHHAFAHEFSSHVVSISTMGRGIRVTFAAGLVVVVLPMLLSLLRGHLGDPTLTIFLGIALPSAMKAVLYFVELLITVFGWYGLITMRGRYRPVIFVILSAIFAMVCSTHPVNSWRMTFPLFSLLACWAFFDWRESFRKYAWALALVLALEFFTVIILSMYAGATELLYEFFLIQIALSAFGLCMVATDIAEITSVGSALIVERLSGRRHLDISSIVTFVASVGLSLIANWILRQGIYGTRSGNLEAGLIAFSALALLVGGLRLLAKNLPAIPEHIAYRSLFLIVAAYIAGYCLALSFWCPATGSCAPVKSYAAIPFIAMAFAVALFLSRNRARRSAALLYGTITGIWILFLHFTASGYIAIAMTIASVAFVAFAVAAPSLRMHSRAIAMAAARLNFCLGIFLTVSWVAARPQANHELNIVNVVIALTALTWDIMTSGGGITNRHTDNFPRSARVALFFAYVLTTSLQVAISATGDMTNWFVHGKDAGVFFEAEYLMSAGLANFGIPFFIWLFTLDVRNALTVNSDAAALSQPVEE